MNLGSQLYMDMETAIYTASSSIWTTGGEQLDRKEVAEEFARSIRENHGASIEEVILFGSVARGEDGVDSDIDIVVVGNGDRFRLRRMIMIDVMRFLLEYGVYISTKVLTRELKEDIGDSGFMQTIRREGIPIG